MQELYASGVDPALDRLFELMPAAYRVVVRSALIAGGRGRDEGLVGWLKLETELKPKDRRRLDGDRVAAVNNSKAEVLARWGEGSTAWKNDWTVKDSEKLTALVSALPAQVADLVVMAKLLRLTIMAKKPSIDDTLLTRANYVMKVTEGHGAQQTLVQLDALLTLLNFIQGRTGRQTDQQGRVAAISRLSSLKTKNLAFVALYQEAEQIWSDAGYDSRVPVHMLLDAVEYSTKVHIEREMVEVLRTLATRYESVGGPAQRLLKTVRGLQLAYAESDVPMTLMAVALDQNTPPELLRDMLQQGERGAKRAKAKEIEEGKKGGGGKGGGTAGTPAVDALQPKPEAEDSPTTATPSPKYGRSTRHTSGMASAASRRPERETAERCAPRPQA
jgi:hypothetical protein